jgi:NADH pyrophosphatase NudC (nudix superfamily)
MNDRPRYCGHCGQPLAAADDEGHLACQAARVLDPPRYCPYCGRRQVVKVTPAGWSSHCARHGGTASVS